MTQKYKLKNYYSGFTLIEIAVVLVIIGIILSGVVGTFTSTMDNSRIRQTQQLLDEVKEALLGFSMINDRLPCPVLAASTDGEEDPLGGGTCSGQHGFVPTKDLGLKGKVSDKNILLDAWGNPIRYSIDNGSSWEFTNPITSVSPPATSFSVNNLNSACSQTLTSDAVVAIIYSTGKNGKNIASYSAAETENTDADDSFVMTQFKEAGHSCRKIPTPTPSP